MESIRHQIATFFRRWARPTGVSVRQHRAQLNLTALEARDVPATLTVNTLADSSQQVATLSLRDAIQVVNAGSATGFDTAQVSGPLGTNDTIIFDPTVFTGATITATGTALPTLSKSVNIQGLGPTLVKIDGNQLGSVLTVGATATVSISGVTLTNGKATLGGGGIDNLGTLTVANSQILNNIATQNGGGGLLNNGGTLTVTNSTISGNTVTAGSGDPGGGIFAMGGTVTIANSTISGNSADSDAGISNSGATMTVVNTTVTGNTSATTGGGIGNAGTIFVANSTVSGNTAGAVVITGATWAPNVATITTATAHNLVVGQTVTVTGINPAGYNGTFVVITASGNTFTYALATNPGSNGVGGTLPGGGGIYNSFGSQLQLQNTTVTGNTNGNIIGTFELVPLPGQTPPVLTPSSSTLPTARVGQGYSQTISASGSGTVSLSISGVSLPPGLTVSQSGPGGPITISGTPTVPGSVTGTITVTASNQFGTTSATYNVTVTQAPTVSVAFGPAGFVIMTVDSNGNLSSNGSIVATGVRDASVAFGPTGIVVLVTYQTGALVEYSASGVQTLTAGGIQGASVAFEKTGLVLLITTEAGAVYQFDPTGLHLLADQGFLGASVAFEPSGEVLLATTTDGTLYRLDATGLHVLLTDASSAGITYGPFGEIMLVTQFDGSLLAGNATGLNNIGTVA